MPLTPSRQKLAPADANRSLGFNRSETELAALYERVGECDVLMTHGPALGRLDSTFQYGGVPRPEPIRIGSAALRDAVDRCIRPSVHVFGHEHDSRGVLREDACCFVNASAADGDRAVLRQGGSYKLKRDFRATVVDMRLGQGLDGDV